MRSRSTICYRYIGASIKTDARFAYRPQCSPLTAKCPLDRFLHEYPKEFVLRKILQGTYKSVSEIEKIRYV